MGKTAISIKSAVWILAIFVLFGMGHSASAAASLANYTVMTSLIQPDGKIFIGGDFTTYNNTSISRVARLDAGGSLDTTFNPGSGANGVVNASDIQSDGKIIIVGNFTYYNGVYRNRVARLNADGTLDTTFDPGSGANSTASTVKIQPDGKIVVGGYFTAYNGTSINRIARINTNGTFDTAFNPGAGVGGTVNSIAIQSDGKIIVGGNFTTCGGATRNRIARLNADGSLDTSFVPTAGANNIIYGVGLQSDGKIIAVGDFTLYNSVSRSRVVSINTDGTLDAAFTPGTGANAIINSMALQSDGKVIIGGGFSTYNGTSRVRIARLNSSGSLDTSFVPGSGANNNVWSIVVQSDGKILIGGAFSTYGGVTQNYIARLSAGGLSETTFGMSASAVTTNAVYASNAQTIGGGLVTDTGGSNPARYVEWGTASGIYTNSCSAGSGGVGSYSCYIVGLVANTTYYVRAKATNSVGTSYGNELSFTTPNAPSVATQLPTDISKIYATGNASVADTGGENPVRSIEWGISSGNYSGNCSSGSGSLGAYSCSMGSLVANTTYYMRAKAVNSGGVSYGDEIVFQTLPVSVPVVTTGQISNVEAFQVTGMADMSDSGGESPERQIEWGTSSGVYTNHCSASAGWEGVYYCNLTGLAANTTYYIRAKVTNSAGTSYGDEAIFITPATATIVTQVPTGIASSLATGNVEIVNTGRENPDVYIQWGAASGSYTHSCSAGSGDVGTYSCLMNGLSQDTTYYFRAKAVNSAGTTYGNEENFQTLQAAAGFAEQVVSNEFQGGGIAQGWHGDDTSWSYTLPFAFNFYGTDYSSIKVGSNGLVCLDNSYSCNYADNLNSSNNGPFIALMALDLHTGTNAGNDIYVTENLDNVVIRWSATQYGRSDNLNFEVVLHSNGNFKFNYGAQEAVLTYGAVVGISSGDGIAYTGSIYNGTTDFNQVATSSWGMSSITVSSPAVITQAAENVNVVSATGKGMVTNTGGKNPARFIEWGTASGNYTSSCSAGVGGAVGFSCNMTGLNQDTTYYVRSKATNSSGTAYGSEVSFTTHTSLSSVTTLNVTDITGSQSTGNATVTWVGIDNPERFIEWGTTSGNYTHSCTVGTGGNGKYSCAMDGLVSGTTYYVRARATNSAGSSYGVEKIFVPRDYNKAERADGEVDAVVAQSDGKIVIGGSFQNYNGFPRNGIARVNADGTLDDSFRVGEGFFADISVYALAIQSDGKIIAGGYFYWYNGVNKNSIIRLNSDGSIDNTFNMGDGITYGDKGEVYSIVIQSDGKILVGGNFASYNHVARSNVARLNPDGTLDTTFITDSNIDYYSGTRSLALQANGKIIVGGGICYYSNFLGRDICEVGRLNADGTLDDTFNPDDGSNRYDDVYTVAVQPDGKILIGGQLDWGVSRSTLIRLNADGSVDSAFNNGGTGLSYGYPYALAVQSDGKIVVVGEFSRYNDSFLPYENFVRLNPDGAIDEAFDFSLDSANVKSIVLRPDGRIVVGGRFSAYGGSDWVDTNVAVFNADGSADTSFGGAIKAVVETRNASLVAATQAVGNGNVVGTGGDTANSVGQIEWGTHSGIYTDSCSAGSGGTGEYSCAMNGLSNGATYYYRSKVTNVAGTNYGSEKSFVAGDYNITSLSDNRIHTTAIQSDGKIIIGGEFTTYNDIARNRIARINTDGTIDVSFDPGSGVGESSYCSSGTMAGGSDIFCSSIYASAIQSDGKILIAGDFTAYNGAAIKNIVRLNPDGTLDATFDPGSGSNERIYSVAIQPDGKMLIAGNFTTYAGESRNGVARLNSDGTLDVTFDPGAGSDGDVYAVVVQADGKIIIGGGMTTYNGTAVNSIVRINSDGSLDTSFEAGAYIVGSYNSVRSIALQSDGKILIGGLFSTGDYYYETAVGIARLNSDGSIDHSFNPGTGIGGGHVDTVALQSDGKIFISGTFTSYGNENTGKIIRLNSDGSLDTAFDTGSGVRNTAYCGWGYCSYVYATIIQPNGKIIIGGDFDEYNGTTRGNIARLNADGSLDTSFGREVTITAPTSILATPIPTNIAQTTATGNGEVTDTGGEDPERFIEWGVVSGVYTESCTAGIGGTGTYSCDMTNLVPNTAYYVRIKLVNSAGAAYGQEATFQTLSTQSITTPTLTTLSPASITQTTATGNANLTDTGGEDPTRTIEWGTITNTYTNSCSTGIGSAGTYSCNLTSLTPDTTYYIRATATNSAGTSYGQETTLHTLAPLPSSITIIDPNPAKMNAALSSNYFSISSGASTSTPKTTTNVGVTFQTSMASLTLPVNTEITKSDAGNFNLENFVTADRTAIVKQTFPNTIAAVKVGVTDTKINFSNIATLSIDVDPSYNNASMYVFYQEDGETDWTSQTTCVITGGKCSFSTDHATTYAVKTDGTMVGQTGINLNTDVQEIISLDCGSTAINLGNITPGIPITGSSTCTATTNANGGYNLSVRRDDATSTLKKNTESSVTISDLTPWDPTTPNSNTWSGNGLGFTVYHSTANKNASWWGTGTTLTDSNNKYAGFNTTQTDIMRNSTYAATSTATDIGYMLNVPPTQKSGAYSGSVTYQATTTP